MTDDLKSIRADVLALCTGHPHAKIAWPHREIHAIADRLATLADREQPGTDGSAATGSEQKSLSGEAGWIEWAGGENPVPGRDVEWRNVNGSKGQCPSDELCGWGENHPWRIVAYRIAPSSQGREGGSDGR